MAVDVPTREVDAEPEHLTKPERDRRFREAARRYLENDLDYHGLSVVRRALYDPERTTESTGRQTAAESERE